MNLIVSFLTRTPVIIAAFVATIVVGWSFTLIIAAVDGALLDTILTGDEASARLAEMTGDQRYVHFIGTIANDTLFPIAYGSFFAGLAARFAPEKLRTWVVLPALATVIVDLAENTVQALALSGTADYLGFKDVLTPLKYGLFYLSLILALGFAALALARWLVRRLNS
ncbi:hypothetical protein WNY37_08820 [Henriciella sp. AS95]|uniref:hypothetical protein n=1 Tax=Henriciella sp. AS95 TaxID=3135782 RepID=UPI0031739B08